MKKLLKRQPTTDMTVMGFAPCGVCISVCNVCACATENYNTQQTRGKVLYSSSVQLNINNK